MNILIISIADNQSYWEELIPEIETIFGDVHIKEENEIVDSQIQNIYNLIIIDVTKLRDLPGLVSMIKNQIPNGIILIATSAPTWTEARKAFYLGATDYIRMQTNTAEMLKSLEVGYKKSLHKGPQNFYHPGKWSN